MSFGDAIQLNLRINPNTDAKNKNKKTLTSSEIKNNTNSDQKSVSNLRSSDKSSNIWQLSNNELSLKKSNDNIKNVNIAHVQQQSINKTGSEDSKSNKNNHKNLYREIKENSNKTSKNKNIILNSQN